MSQSANQPARRAWSSTYRPLLNRLTFGLALVGVLVAVHLAVQQRQGFAQGCFGFSEAGAAGGAFNCATVLQSGAGELLGVSNVVWGFLFYLAVAALSFAIAFVGRTWGPRLKQARAGLIGFGVLYSAYLVYYQFAYLDSLCALCLLSAALVALLLGVQVYDYRTADETSATKTMTARPVKREAALFTSLVALVVLLAGADVLYFNNNAAAPAASAAASDTLQVAEGCFYSAEQPPVENPDRLVNFADPVVGNEDAAVTVIEYFDPNCPHCATFHPVMQQLIATYGDRARFVYKPLYLGSWTASARQIEALYAAEQAGKFQEMLRAQFERQQRQGLTMADLRAIAEDIGMDPGTLAGRIQSGIYRSLWRETRQQASEVGLRSVPTVLINGRFVANRSRTPRCLAAMIEAAAEG